MRHLLWIPMLLVGLLMLLALADLADGGTVLQSLQFILLMVVEAVLFAAWVVACEVAANRKWVEAAAEDNRNELRLLRRHLEGVAHGGDEAGGKSEAQIQEEQAARALKEELLAGRLKEPFEGPRIWIGVVVVTLLGMLIYFVSLVESRG